MAGALHHGIIDRFRVRASERSGVERHKTEVIAGRLDGLNDRGRTLRFEGAIFFEQERGAKQEVAGVPQITVGDVAFGFGGIWLFDETLDGENTGRNGCAAADVAILGGSTPRLYAKRDDPAFGGGRGHNTCFRKRARVGHDMIGGHCNHNGVFGAAVRERSTGSNGRARIAPHRLKQNIGFHADGCELLRH